MSGLDKDLFIRCSNKTRRRFRRIYVDNDFKNFEKTLEALLSIAEAHPELFKEKGIRWG